MRDHPLPAAPEPLRLAHFAHDPFARRRPQILERESRLAAAEELLAAAVEMLPTPGNLEAEMVTPHLHRPGGGAPA